jgi:hypothetical protein
LYSRDILDFWAILDVNSFEFGLIDENVIETRNVIKRYMRDEVK